ncbi:MAG: acetylxylan esterase [Candidatus Ratteibacteria bacterium]|nr:acetylxylan esterase [Candidatus Ratteibacteria bacterium]
MVKRKIITIFILCFFTCGCSSAYYPCLSEEEILSKASRVIELSELEKFYAYDTNHKNLEVCLIKGTPRYKIYRIKFPFALKSLFPEKDFVELEYYLPRGEGKFPAVVILPHLAGKSGLESFFSQGLIRNDFAVLTLGEPYFTRDRREGRWWMHQIQQTQDLEKIEMLFRQLVIDTRRGIDFLESRPEIDRDKIGILGLSLGGSLAVLVAGIDKRVKLSVFLLAGGDLVTLIRESQYTEILRRHMAQGNISFKSMEESWMKIEPLVLASYLDDRPVLMINATFDHLVPSGCTKKLWQALGNPRIIWIPSGHYGAAIFLTFARRETIRFFVKHLSP